MTIFVRDLGFPEAPVLLPDGSFLFTEMTPATGCVTWVSRDGRSRRCVATTGRPNGLAADGRGSYWVAETAQRALLKLTLDGACEVFAGVAEGRPFRFLNDLAFAPNGDLYLTDSGIDLDAFAPNGEISPSWRTLPYDGRVYRVDVRTGAVETVDRGLRFTNGIAFGSDRRLYVAETATGLIHRYEWSAAGGVGAKSTLGDAIDPDGPAGITGPDGMKFGADGNLYVAVFGQAHVAVLDPRGKVVRRIRTQGSMPTNLTFAAPGEQRIFVTEAETGTVQIFDVGTDGCPLYC